MSYIDSVKKDGDNIVIEKYDGSNLQVLNTSSLENIDKKLKSIRNS